MFKTLLDVFLDAGWDCLKMLPFLFPAFLLMEALEHHGADKMNIWLKRTGAFGPLVGSCLGIVPQCGFSVIASEFYAGGVISLGTLLAVYLSTSDEALIILLSGLNNGGWILKIVLAKIIIGVIAGYLVMIVMRLLRINRSGKDIGDLCRDDNCGCKEEDAGILKPALYHTVKIWIFLFVFTLILDLVLELVGFQSLAKVLLHNSVFQPLFAALLGLIPSCASSILLTDLFLEGILSFGSVVAGLSTAAGLGLVVLFR
ncbi:MAG: arsenic efflux protein, partial [Lachnospiraceae bacterium]|nr:arsenic efflux protein [Candidatus Equihabitans merdae]